MGRKVGEKLEEGRERELWQVCKVKEKLLNKFFKSLHDLNNFIQLYNNFWNKSYFFYQLIQAFYT